MPKKTNRKNPFIVQECIDMLNFRIQQEEESARLYHSMSMWLNDNGYMGAAKQWEEDSKGEMAHAQWAKDFLLDMGVQPKIGLLRDPPQDFGGFEDIIIQSYDHEVEVTEQCTQLADYALKSGNHLLYQLTIKYLQEQQEELGKLQTLLDELEAFGNDKIALRLLDSKLAQQNAPK